MANEWKAFEIQVPGKDFLEPVRSVLETLLMFLEVLKSILDTIQTFLIDFGNPIKALVEALLRLIEEFIAALTATGVHGYFDVPDTLEDPNFARIQGGFDSFIGRWGASLYDTADPNRPRPREGSTRSGFVILLIKNSDPYKLVEDLQSLLEFFGQSFRLPRFAAPANAEAFPVGEDNDPITAVASIFQQPIKAMEVRWQLPSTVQEGNQLGDLVAKTVREMIPPKFLVERAEILPTTDLDVSYQDGGQVTGDKVDLDTLNSSGSVGKLLYARNTLLQVPGKPAERVLDVTPLQDEHKEQWIKFQKYISIDGANLTNILGQLGTYRYIDTDVILGSTYYYRVRAYSGSLDIDEGEGLLRFKQVTNDGQSGGSTLRWPTPDGKRITVGQPTGVLTASLPEVPLASEFDVMHYLKKVFQVAFSLDFHRPIETESTETEYHEGKITVVQEATSIDDIQMIGRGSLVDLAGLLSNFRSLPYIPLAKAQTLREFDGVSTGSVYPWQRRSVRFQAARLANDVASAMLAADSMAASKFQSLMTIGFPADPPIVENMPDDSGPITNLAEYVDAFAFESDTEYQDDSIYTEGYANTAVRTNVLEVVNWLKSLALVGTTPDWVALTPLRDLIPWSSDLLFDILDAVRKLVEAYKGVISEINAFIELLERKIQALEDLLRYLISILEFIESFNISAMILSVTGLSGGPDSWVQAVNEAEGAVSIQDPSDYAAGVSFGYVGVDVAAFERAFNLIF